MTSEDILNVAQVVLEYWFEPFVADLEEHQKQEILDRYYQKHGVDETYDIEWDRLAEGIR